MLRTMRRWYAALCFVLAGMFVVLALNVGQWSVPPAGFSWVLIATAGALAARGVYELLRKRPHA